MNRTNLILAGLLAVQGVALAAIHLLPQEATQSAADKGLLLPDLKVEDIDSVVVSEGTESSVVNATDTRVTLRRVEGRWVVAERWDFPADGEKVDTMLRELAALEIADVVSTTGLHESGLKVAETEFAKKVTIATAAGERTLLVGTSGRGGSTHVRLAGDKRVVAVRNLTGWRVSGRPDGWLQRAVIDVDPTAVTGLTLTFPDRSLVLAKGEAGWTVLATPVAPLPADTQGAPLPADTAAVEALLAKAAKVSLSKVRGPMEAPSGAPALTVILDVSGTKSSYALFAGETESTWLLRAEGGMHLVELGQWAVTALFEATGESLSAKGAPEGADGPTDPGFPIE